MCKKAFKLLDTEKRGSFNAENFISIYQESEEYKNLTENQKLEFSEKLRKDFQVLAVQGEITPIEFYQILNPK